MFSVPYCVERLDDSGSPTGEEAFLKALDYSRASEMDMPQVDAVKVFVDAFIWERDLVLQCAARRMSNVIVGLAAGEVTIAGHGPFSAVNYIIFERAEEDVRKRLDRVDPFELAWRMRVLHNVANGLRQLHQVGVMHQDLKPSNVLMFDKGSVSKVGDLGRASQRDREADHDGCKIPGDPLYAPPELHYGDVSENIAVRRQASDLYHLGSLVLFMFTKVGTTAALVSRLDEQFRPGVWSESYRQVLPHVREAFDQVAVDLAKALPPALADDVVNVFRQLCDPDPLLRGNTMARAGTSVRYSLERYVTHFDRLARRAEVELRAVLAT